MKFIRTIFFPFSILYAWFMSVRNKQFNTGQRTQTQFDRVVISVGNLSMGGTGKTPMIELLIRMLKNEYQVATISRGYGRKTRGFRRANTDDTASTIGDEPFQFFKKFGNEIAVSVCEERILAIPSLLLDDDSLEVFLLDDAFQHRQAGRDLDIMLTDYNHPFYKDYVLPTGNLREPRKGAGRADMIVVTKCPADLKSAEKEERRASEEEAREREEKRAQLAAYDAKKKQELAEKLRAEKAALRIRLDAELAKGQEFNDLVRVSDVTCVAGCRRAVAREGLLVGGSGGGVLEAVRGMQDELAGLTVAAIIHDSGSRYLGTVFDPEWVERELGICEADVTALAGLAPADS